MIASSNASGSLSASKKSPRHMATAATSSNTTSTMHLTSTANKSACVKHPQRMLFSSNSSSVSMHTANSGFDTCRSSAHRAQLERLQHLVAHKASIEAAMAKQLAGLKKAYDAHSRDVQSVVSRRLKEMK